MTEEGNKYDSGKPRLDLIPPEAEYALGCVLAYGAGKYADRNWEKGFAWGRSVGALKRHLTAWEAGQDRDPESGLPHLWHVLTNAAFLVAFESRGVGTDDRPQGCAVHLWNMRRGGMPSSGSEEEGRKIAAAAPAISCPYGISELCAQPCCWSGVCPVSPGDVVPVKCGVTPFRVCPQ
jgi:hypothetical protein